MKKLGILPILLALTLWMTACGAMAAAPKSADHLDLEEETVLTGTVETEESRWNYEITTYTVTGEHCAPDDPDRVLIRHSYQMPRMKASNVQDDKKEQSGPAAKQAVETFNAFFETRLQDEVAWFEEMASVAEEDYGAVGHEKGSFWQQEDFCYSDETTLSFWATDDMICITTLNYSFTGGAHPIVWRTANSFDLRTGKEVTVAELTGNVAGLQKAVEEELLRQVEEKRLLPEQEMTTDKIAFFDDYEETVADWMERSVSFGDDGMQVIFGVYDIAPYAAGEQVFTISYDLLRPYLNSYGKTLLGLE